jgi:hypothetical protein
MVAAPVELNGTPLLLDPSGAVFWREHGLLAVADLHLEKGSAFARRGTMLPPYDTQATLDGLTRVVRRWQPRTVLCLGDSFHDTGGPERLTTGDRTRLAALTRGREWVWIVGNHDPVVGRGRRADGSRIAIPSPSAMPPAPRPARCRSWRGQRPLPQGQRRDWCPAHRPLLRHRRPAPAGSAPRAAGR